MEEYKVLKTENAVTMFIKNAVLMYDDIYSPNNKMLLRIPEFFIHARFVARELAKEYDAKLNEKDNGLLRKLVGMLNDLDVLLSQIVSLITIVENRRR